MITNFDVSIEDYLDQTKFCINIIMQEEGTIQFFNIVAIIFNYLNMLKETVVTDKIYQQLSWSSYVKFSNFQEEINQIKELAINRALYSYSDVFNGNKLFQDYNK